MKNTRTKMDFYILHTVEKTHLAVEIISFYLGTLFHLIFTPSTCCVKHIALFPNTILIVDDCNHTRGWTIIM